jgi:hypothetical protein
MPLFLSDFVNPKLRKPSFKAPNFNIQITNKSQIPILNDQNTSEAETIIEYFPSAAFAFVIGNVLTIKPNCFSELKGSFFKMIDSLAF